MIRQNKSLYNNNNYSSSSLFNIRPEYNRYRGMAQVMAARAIWKGSVSFGLVNIPIQVFSATQKED